MGRQCFFIQLGSIPRLWGRRYVLRFFHFCIWLVHEPCKSGRNTPMLCVGDSLLGSKNFISPQEVHSIVSYNVSKGVPVSYSIFFQFPRPASTHCSDRIFD